MIPVYENYADYQPPGYARATVAKLLAAVPQAHLSGLRSVVLTNGAAIGTGKAARVTGKKYARRECLGFYHAKLKGRASVDRDRCRQHPVHLLRSRQARPLARCPVGFTRLRWQPNSEGGLISRFGRVTPMCSAASD